MSVKKAFTLAIVCVMSVLSGVSCTSMKSAMADNDSTMNSENVESISIKIGNKMLDAIRTENYDAFSAAYDSRDTKFTPEEFKTSCEKYRNQFGEIKSFRYMTQLQTPLVQNNIWVVTFEREAGQGKEKETITQQLLFRLVTGEIDGMTRVLGLGFF